VNGVLLLSFGIVGVADPRALANMIWWIPGVQSMRDVIDIPSVVVSSSVFMIILGSIMMLFGFLGCAGVAFNSKWLLFFYWILLLGLIVAEIALIIYAAVSPSTTAVYVQKVMYSSLSKHFDPVSISGTAVTLPGNAFSLAWVSMQFEVGCCGAYNSTDYETFKWNNTIDTPHGSQVPAKVPPSCCVLQSRHVPHNTDQFNNLNNCLEKLDSYNDVGCYVAVQKLVKQYSYIPIGICSAVICIELVAITMAIYLWRLRTSKTA
jgi:hypothetical protein